jgi:GNAT superfamily N-acetyltransferase
VIGLYAVPRPLEPADAPRLVRMFDRLSRETVFRRFFTGSTKLDGVLLRALTSVDHERHEALVVAVGDEIVALASYHRHADDPSVADVAVLVEDGWQHQGLGQRLTRQLGRIARARGVARFHAEVLAENRPVIEMIRRMGPGARPRLDGGELEYDLPLRPAA